MEGRHSPFLLPSCLKAHATPNHENGDRAPCNTPSARQHPLTPATAPGPPAVPCSEYTHTHTKPKKILQKATIDYPSEYEYEKARVFMNAVFVRN